uniref:GTPase IMAP family member 8 n=1 Tax=Xiphophorus maculatus TaxID=8083 RepID=A0A3B5R5L6_XIPMA
MNMSEYLREGFNGSSASDLRLLLLGNIGCGKTSSGDTILGQLSPSNSDSSRICAQRQGVTEGRSVTIVEAPRWYWVGSNIDDDIKKETERAMTLVAPGPHAVLLLVPVCQFTEIEGRVPAELEKLFGTEVLDHTLVLLTCGDYLMGKSAEEYLQREDPGLRQVIDRCGGRYHVFNNRQRQDKQQVQELLEKIDDMVQRNGVFYMKTAQERELEKRVLERKRELMESFKAQKEEKKKPVVVKSDPDTGVSGRGEEAISTVERKREYKDEVEGRVDETQVSSGLCSSPAPEQPSHSEPQEDTQFTRTPSFRLNADGAKLSQISEAKSKPKLISTFHHRINSFEENSPETVSPPHSPVFSFSSHSTQTFAASPSPISQSSTPPSSPSLPSSTPEVRLVLLGLSGSGKSAAGNTILGQAMFESNSESFTAATQKCEKKKAMVDGKRVSVVDTPDWFNSEQTPDEPAKTELQALSALAKVFGPEAVQKHTVVLFTYADRLRESGKAGGKSVEEYIASQRGDLVKLVEKCTDRFHVMEKGQGWRQKKNVAELLEKVEQTVKEAGGQCYSSPAFQEVEDRVRQRQLEIVRERKGIKQETALQAGQLSTMRQPLAQINEEITEDEIGNTRDEAEMSVSNTSIDSLPTFTPSTMSPTLLRSIMEKMESSGKMLPKLLANSSAWVGQGAKQVKDSPVWGNVGSGAQNFQKIVVDSSVWEKMGATAGQISKAVRKRVPQKFVDGSEWVGSGAKAVTASPMWEKMGSGAKLVASGSKHVGAGLGTGAKKLAKSPMWGKMGSGAKTGVKLVAQSPVWGKMGSEVKSRAKMVKESSVWGEMGNAAKQVPKMVIIGAILGLVFGVILAGVIGGVVGTAAGSGVSEVVRRKFSKKNTSDGTRNSQITVDNSIDGTKLKKTE